MSGPRSEIQTTEEPVRRYLVVGNLTVGGDSVAAQVLDCMAAGPCRFFVLVPASPPDPRSLTWSEEETYASARMRLVSALARFRALGAEVEGEVGDGMPLLAIEDALRARAFDEIILSTLPPGRSRWLKLDLLHRLASRFRLPIRHVVGSAETPAAEHVDAEETGIHLLTLAEVQPAVERIR
jgi:hypothetical protein